MISRRRSDNTARLQYGGGWIVVALAMTILGSAVATPAAACAACACGDPTLTSMGFGKPSDGRLRLSLDETLTSVQLAQHVVTPSQTDAPDATKEHLAGIRGRTTLALTAFVHSDVALSVEVAWAVQRTTSSQQKTLWTAGLADATLRARWFIWRDRPFAPKHLVALTGGLVVPSPFQVLDQNGAPVSLDVQPSFGAFVADAGVLYSAFPTGWLRPFSLYVSAKAFAATPGFDDVILGPGVSSSVTLQFQPVAATAIQMGFDTRSDLPATLGSTLMTNAPTIRSRGGHLAMLHAGIVLSPVQDLLVRFLVRAPVVNLRDDELEGAHAMLGVVWDL